MAHLKPGDRIRCCIKDFFIVSPYQEYDEILTFEIVAVNGYGYYLYVPDYIMIKDALVFNEYKCKNLNINHKFYNQYFTHIPEKFVYQIRSILDGMTCTKCKEFFWMAESNQENGSLICWACRDNRYRG